MNDRVANGFSENYGTCAARVVAGAVALALFGASMAVDARRLEVAAPQNWKAGDGTGVAAIFDALRAVPHASGRRATMAVTTPVTSCADDGSSGTLRSVVTGANDGDTVDLRGLACGPIKLTQGVIPVYADTLTLIGDGADKTVIDGNAADRVFLQYGYDALNLRNLTVRNGFNQVSGYKIAGGACILANALRHARPRRRDRIAPRSARAPTAAASWRRASRCIQVRFPAIRRRARC